MVEEAYVYKRPGTLTGFLKVCLILEMIVAIGLTACCVFFSGDIGALNAGDTSLTEGGGLYGVGCLLILVFLVLNLILFMFWVYRMNSNSRAQMASGMAYTPAWAVGWFFIPFANLWRPYQVMSELYRTSQNPIGWKSRPAPALIGWWWGANILSNIVGGISGKLDGHVDLTTSTIFSIATFALWATHVGLQFLVVSRISAAQKKLENTSAVAEVF